MFLSQTLFIFIVVNFIIHKLQHKSEESLEISTLSFGTCVISLPAWKERALTAEAKRKAKSRIAKVFIVSRTKKKKRILESVYFNAAVYCSFPSELRYGRQDVGTGSHQRDIRIRCPRNGTGIG